MPAEYRQIVKQLLEDQDARNELVRCADLDEAATVAAKYAKKHGHDVSPEALRQAFIPLGGELSDAELEAVAGGKSPHENIKGDSSVWALFAFLFGQTSGAVFNDEIDGGDGNDTIWGGLGDDTLYGGDGDDSMDGGWGIDDTIDGDDSMDGGAGNDTMWGSQGDDEMHGGTGNDNMHGNQDNDTLYGDEGNDQIYGDEGDDELHGGAGDDTLDGGEGEDELNGGAGNDVLRGGQGNDILDGGAGNDTLYGESGHDILTGGEGRDLFIFNNDSGRDLITDFDPSNDKLRFDGAWSIDDISVVSGEGRTYIQYGNSTIILDGVEMTAEEVWARRG